MYITFELTLRLEFCPLHFPKRTPGTNEMTTIALLFGICLEAYTCMV